jgi:hypothetical protein
MTTIFELVESTAVESTTAPGDDASKWCSVNELSNGTASSERGGAGSDDVSLIPCAVNFSSVCVMRGTGGDESSTQISHTSPAAQQVRRCKTLSE